MPLFAFIVLFKTSRTEDESNTTRQNFLILYQGLRKEHFYWEFINSLRKICILISFVLPSQYQIFTALTVLISTSRFQNKLQPYKLKCNNEIEILGVSISVITLCCGLIFNQEVTSTALNNLLVVIMVVVNIFFILKWLYLLFLNVLSKYYQMFNSNLSRTILKFIKRQTSFSELVKQSTLITKQEDRKLFRNLAELLKARKVPLISIIKDHVFDFIYEQKETQLIYADDFFESLRNFGLEFNHNEQEEAIENLRAQGLYGKFPLEIIERILSDFGVQKGLPKNTKRMDYSSLDLESMRFINRILRYIKVEVLTENNELLKKSKKKSSNAEITTALYNQLKPLIKNDRIGDDEEKFSNVEYIDTKDFVAFFRRKYISLKKKDPLTSKMMFFKSRILSDKKLSDNLQSLLSCRQRPDSESIRFKNFLSLIRKASNCPYILAIGCLKRSDPHESEEVPQINKRELSSSSTSRELCGELDVTKVRVANGKRGQKKKKIWKKRSK